jgi:uncharacterized membrane protein
MSETSSTESGITTASVTVQRSPRYMRFFFVGIVLGVIVALILTVSFPADPEFSQTQIFGFLVIFTASAGAVLGLVFALLIDRLYSRHVITTTAERTSINEAIEAEDTEDTI